MKENFITLDNDYKNYRDKNKKENTKHNEKILSLEKQLFD
jgi:hypothetical protein